MIIFDLDGTLADCEHRRHFVDPRKDLNLRAIRYADNSYDVHTVEDPKLYKWEPDYKSFYEACDKDKPIEPVIDIFLDLVLDKRNVEIWSGRCESVRIKTLDWMCEHIFNSDQVDCNSMLKMRPIGDNTPDDQLKEKWLDEEIAKGNNVEFVFDDRPKVIRMWRRRGIFVFNCCQHEGEF